MSSLVIEWCELAGHRVVRVSLVVEWYKLAHCRARWSYNGVNSLVIEWCEFTGRIEWCDLTGRIELCELTGDHGASDAAHSLGGVLSTTAWDPAPVGNIALCPLVAPAKVEMLANILACIVGGSLNAHQMVE